MFRMDINELFSINRNSLIGVSISVILYNALNITNDPEKRDIIKNTALLILVYSLVNVIIFNTIIFLQFYHTRSHTHITFYSLFTLFMIIVIVYMLYRIMG